jgi:hypothetical protein
MSQKQDRGKVRGLTPTSPTTYVHCLPVQMAALFARNQPTLSLSAKAFGSQIQPAGNGCKKPAKPEA